MKAVSAAAILAAVVVLVPLAVYDAGAYRATENMFVSADYLAGPMAVEVVINDPALDENSDAAPNVTVNDENLRMVQATDGTWYAYFTSYNMSSIVDQGGSDGSADAFKLGAPLESLDGYGDSGAVALYDLGNVATGVIREPPALSDNPANDNSSGTLVSWPAIQAFSFADKESVSVQYHKAGGIQPIVLHYFDADDHVRITTDRDLYPLGALVHIAIEDQMLNIDPTSKDTWTFGTNSFAGLSTSYYAFSDDGMDADFDADITGLLTSLSFDDNGALNITSNGVLEFPSTMPNYSVTLVETGPNSGEFRSANWHDSQIKIAGNASRAGEVAIEYNDSVSPIAVSHHAGTLLINSTAIGAEWSGGEAVPVLLTDGDLNYDSLALESVGIGSSYMPAVTIGSPITLADTFDNRAGSPSALAAFTNRTGQAALDAPRQFIADPYSKKALISSLPAEEDSIRFHLDRADNAFVNDTGVAYVVNYDVRSLGPQARLAETGNATVLMPDAASGMAIISGIPSPPVLEFGIVCMGGDFSSAGECIAPTVDSPAGIAVDIFRFGQKSGSVGPVDRYADAVYRLALQETGKNAGNYSGSISYVKYNQINIADFEAITSYISPTIDDGITVIIPSSLAREDGVRADYYDLDSDGIYAQISDQIDVRYYSGAVSFESANYGVGQTVNVVLNDPDLDTDTNTVQTYAIPEGHNAIGGDGPSRLLDITFDDAAWEYHDGCGIDARSGNGLRGTGFALVETAASSGIFAGSFEVPEQYCTGNSSDAIAYTATRDLGVRYNDFIDSSGYSLQAGDSAGIKTNTGSISLDREVYPLPIPADTYMTFADSGAALGAKDAIIHIRISDSDFDTSRNRDTINLRTHEDLLKIDIVRGAQKVPISTASVIGETSNSSGIFAHDLALGPNLTRAADMGRAAAEGLLTNGTTGQLAFDRLEQGDVITATYRDPIDSSGQVNYAANSSAFSLHNAVLESNRDTYILNNYMVLTLKEPDLNLDSYKTESYPLNIIRWDSEAATVGLGDSIAFDPESPALRETGDNTGIFHLVIRAPIEINGSKLDRGEEITLEYADYGPASASFVGEKAQSANKTVYSSNFGAVIHLDKKSYTWTDQVRIIAIAPDFNFDATAVDEIGSDEDFGVRISTRSGAIDRYRLVETGNDTGIFEGNVTLTGFSGHGLGDNGVYNDARHVNGSGPSNGYLMTDREQAVSVSFEYSRGVFADANAPIKWNIGRTAWLDSVNSVNGTGILRITDPDMNLDPEHLNSFEVDVWSDTDAGGITLIAVETGANTGVFEGTVWLRADKESKGHRLLVSDGDTVIAEYKDYTLPQPFLRMDHYSIAALMTVGNSSTVPAIGEPYRPRFGVPVLVSTDSEAYSEISTINITTTINTPDSSFPSSTDTTLQILSPSGSLIYVGQIDTSKADPVGKHSVLVKTAYSWPSGTYTVKAKYGSNTAETEFAYHGYDSQNPRILVSAAQAPSPSVIIVEFASDISAHTVVPDAFAIDGIQIIGASALDSRTGRLIVSDLQEGASYSLEVLPDRLRGAYGSPAIRQSVPVTSEGSVQPQNLYISALPSGVIAGPMVVEVVVSDPDLSATNETVSEPDVSVNGLDLKMVQASDGNWHAYFAAKGVVQAAASGGPLDYGTGRNNSALSVPDLGIVLNPHSEGYYFNSSKMVRNAAEPARASEGVRVGQVGLHQAANGTAVRDGVWPFIQAFEFVPDQTVAVAYASGSGIQKAKLTYLDDYDADSAGASFDRQEYPAGAQVHMSIADQMLNLDPTSRDSWTLNTNASGLAYYGVFPAYYGSSSGPITLQTDRLSYAAGQTVMIEGSVRDLYSKTPITIQTTSPLGTRVALDQVLPNDDKRFFAEFDIDGGWKQGEYTILATYGGNNRQASATFVVGNSGPLVLGQLEPVRLGELGFDNDGLLVIGQNPDNIFPPEHGGTVITFANNGLQNFDYPYVPTGPNPINPQTGSSHHHVTIYETGPNTGMFTSTDNSGKSGILTSLGLERGSLAEASYRDDLQHIVIAYDMASLLMAYEETGPTWDAREPLPVILHDRDLNLNSKALEQLGSAGKMMPVIQTGSPVTLEDRSDWSAGLSPIADPFSKMATLDAGREGFYAEFDLERYIEGESTHYIIHYDVSRTGQRLDALQIGDTVIAAGLPAGTIDATEALKSVSGAGKSRLVLNASLSGPAMQDAAVSLDIFRFGAGPDETYADAIYRLYLQETGPASGSFAGSISYVMPTQLDVNNASAYLHPAGIYSSQNVTIIAAKPMTVEARYGDIDREGLEYAATAEARIYATSGSVSLNSSSYKAGETAAVRLTDPDLNTDYLTVQTYHLDGDQIGSASDGTIMFEATIGGSTWESQSCLSHANGLGSTGFSLTETAPSSGIFEGEFVVPSQYCGVHNTQESAIGAELAVTYFDRADHDGEPSARHDSARIRAPDRIQHQPELGISAYGAEAVSHNVIAVRFTAPVDAESVNASAFSIPNTEVRSAVPAGPSTVALLVGELEHGGSYEVSVAGGQIRDLDGNAAPEAALQTDPLRILGGARQIMTPTEGRHELGSSVAVIGDVDGDGNADAATGAPGTDSIHIVFLRDDGTVRSSVPITAQDIGAGPSSRLGESVAAVGDIDGDGVPDIAAGASAGAGSAYMILLNNDGSARESRQIGDAADFSLSDNDAFGASLAYVGDTNSDGIRDLVIGSPGAAGGGAAYVARLGPDGAFAGHMAVRGGDINETISAGSQFGAAASFMGDSDHDGITEVAIGAPGRGAVYVVELGSTAAPLYSIGAESDLGLPAGSMFGRSIANMGDINGDGTPDIAVGAAGASGSGVLYIIYLDPAGMPLRHFEVNADTSGIRAPEFASSIAASPDHNGDGVPDILVGSGDDSESGLYTVYPQIGAVTAVRVSSELPDGRYGEGQNIRISVQFSAPVSVDTAGGTPYLVLDLGHSQNAAYAGNDGGLLHFDYVTHVDDESSDLSYHGASALVLNGSKLAGHPVILSSLPAPGSAGSLSFEKDIRIERTRTEHAHSVPPKSHYNLDLDMASLDEKSSAKGTYVVTGANFSVSRHMIDVHVYENITQYYEGSPSPFAVTTLVEKQPSGIGVDRSGLLQVTVGSNEPDYEFEVHAVRIDFDAPGITEPVAYYIDALGQTHEIPACEAEGFASSDEAAAHLEGVEGGSCYLHDGRMVTVWTNHLTDYGVGQSASQADDCNDCQSPTLGKSPAGKQLVSGGFSFNGRAVDVGRYHTPSPLIVTQVNATNTVAVKVYENYGPSHVKRVEFALGIPGVGQWHDAEAFIDVAFERAGTGIKEVTVSDPMSLIEGSTVSASSSAGSCSAALAEEQCLHLEVKYAYREAPAFSTMGVKPVDFAGYAHQFYFNDGIRVDGQSLNAPAEMAISASHAIHHPQKSGLISLVQDDRAAGMWVDEYGIFWHIAKGRITQVTFPEHTVPDDNAAGRHHGPDRNHPHFAQHVQQQRDSAEQALAEILGDQGEDQPDASAKAAFAPEPKDRRSGQEFEQNLAAQEARAQDTAAKMYPRLR